MENRKIEVPSSYTNSERIPKNRDWGGEDEERNQFSNISQKTKFTQ